MALSDVLKRYGETGATEGIMVPSANVQSVTTEQEVYDSATDGIMTINNEQYIGPNATVTYGGEETAYNRMLREIERGELPQFDQSTFPAVGEGIMESSTPVTQSVDTKTVEQPKVDPCPPGYKLIDGVCQLVNPRQAGGSGGGGQIFTGPKITNGIIEGYEDLNFERVDVKRGDFYNKLSPEMKAQYEKALKYQRGIQVKYNEDGEPIRIVAHSPTLGELVGDIGKGLGDILESVNIVNIAKNVFEGEKKEEVVETPKPEEGSTTVTRTGEGPIQEEVTQEDTTTDEPETKKVPTLTMEDFGGIDNISNLVNTYSNDFGEINKFLIDAKDLEERLARMEARPQQLKNRASEKSARNNLKQLIAKNKKDTNDKIKEAKDNEEKLQNEINNSRESNFVVQGKTFTAHRDSNNKIIGYSDKGSNVVNVAGMPPIGPGQRIKKSTASELRENFKNIRSDS